jgi:hypothetical protein
VVNSSTCLGRPVLVTMAEREWQERRHGLMVVLWREDDHVLGRAGPKYWSEFDVIDRAAATGARAPADAGGTGGQC